jgi:RNA polymerase sigma-70 factor, ECF subfamily
MTSTPPDENTATPTIDAAWTHRDDLVLYAGRLLGTHGDLAEDIVQEGYLRLHEQMASGRALRDARPWLFRVTRNLALDERRRIRRGNALQTTLEVVAPQQPGPHDVMQEREDTRQALHGLGQLPPREQRAVILDQAGVAPSAIARLMDTTTNAVHQSLFRARRRMRDTRAAAWALVPLPLVRLMMRAANSSFAEQLPFLAPGSGGRFAGGAGVAGLAVTALIGGGIAAHQVTVYQPIHGSASAAGQPLSKNASANPAPPPPPPAASVAVVGTVSQRRTAATVVRSTRSATIRSRSSVRRPAGRGSGSSAPLTAPPAPTAPPSAPSSSSSERHHGTEPDDHETTVSRKSEDAGEHSAPEPETHGGGEHGGGERDGGGGERTQSSAAAPAEPEHVESHPTQAPAPESGGSDSSTPTENSGSSSTHTADVPEPTPPPEPPEQP